MRRWNFHAPIKGFLISILFVWLFWAISNHLMGYNFQFFTSVSNEWLFTFAGLNSLVGLTIILFLYWTIAFFFGRDEILKIRTANIFLTGALIMFSASIVNEVHSIINAPMTECRLTTTDKSIVAKTCLIDRFWFQAFDIGSFTILAVSLVSRIISSRKMVENTQ